MGALFPGLIPNLKGKRACNYISFDEGICSEGARVDATDDPAESGGGLFCDWCDRLVCIRSAGQCPRR